MGQKAAGPLSCGSVSVTPHRPPKGLALATNAIGGAGQGMREGHGRTPCRALGCPHPAALAGTPLPPAPVDLGHQQVPTWRALLWPGGVGVPEGSRSQHEKYIPVHIPAQDRPAPFPGCPKPHSAPPGCSDLLQAAGQVPGQTPGSCRLLD